MQKLLSEVPPLTLAESQVILTRCHGTVEEGDRVAQLVLERVRALLSMLLYPS